jgi:hypothetical protein
MKRYRNDGTRRINKLNLAKKSLKRQRCGEMCKTVCQKNVKNTTETEINNVAALNETRNGGARTHKKKHEKIYKLYA